MSDLIWDIQREHLDEAEFLVEMFARGVDSPRYTLTSLRAGPEQRLITRIEALHVGGAPVLEQLILPVLDDPEDDEFRTTAAALTILEGAGIDACERVLQTFDACDREGPARRGLVRALGWSRRAGLVPWLAAGLDDLAPPALAARLLALTEHRVNAGARVTAWLTHEHLDVRRAAALLARHTGAPEASRALHRWLDAEDPELRWAAIDSAVIRGQDQAWARVVAAARGGADDEASARRALSWIALIGDAEAHRQLLAGLEAQPSAARLWAAGLSGRPAAVELALALLDHPRLARLAGEVVCAIAGLPVEGAELWIDRGRRRDEDPDDALPALARDDLDAELVPGPDDALRLPQPEAVRAWWAGRRPGFDPARRYLAGRPFDLAALAHALAVLPTRRRHPLALELAARSSGRAQISTHALGLTQAAQTHEVFSRLAHLDFEVGIPLDRPCSR